MEFGIIFILGTAAVIATERQRGKGWRQILSELGFTCMLLIAAFLVGWTIWGCAHGR